MPKKDKRAEEAVKQSTGLLGRAARAISNRQRQLDEAIGDEDLRKVRKTGMGADKHHED